VQDRRSTVVEVIEETQAFGELFRIWVAFGSLALGVI